VHKVYFSTFVIIGLLIDKYHDPENTIIQIHHANLTTSANGEMSEYFPKLLVCMKDNTQPSEWEKFFNLKFEDQDGNMVNLSFSTLLYTFTGQTGFIICSELDWYQRGYIPLFPVANLFWNGITSDVDIHTKFGKQMKSPLKAKNG
jgi:hypothetical protein